MNLGYVAALELERNCQPAPGCQVYCTHEGQTIFGVINLDGSRERDLMIFYVKSPATDVIHGDGLIPTNALGCFIRQSDISEIVDRIKETAERFLAGERGCIRGEVA